MRIAAFNVENLFDRAKAFDENRNDVLSGTAELNILFEQATYSDADKARMLELLRALGLERSDTAALVRLRKIRGSLLRRPRGGAPVTITARGRADWIGWVELRTEPVDEEAMRNTGRVMRDVAADVLAVVEAEDRIVLDLFSQRILEKVGGTPYAQVMLVDGNDERGIDVGLMTTKGYAIREVRSHIYDLDAAGRPIFSRDCPEYAVVTPGGATIWVLPNHFKSKFGGNDASSQRRRRAQAQRTREIYEALIARGEENVVVLGDLNDTPGSEPLEPLLRDTDLKDVSEHPSFDTGTFAGRGTFGLGNDGDKIDYLLLSPALFGKVVGSGLFRKGAWPGARARWEVYPELTAPVHAASDHHVIFADIDIA